jgi:glycosyltransferase involved in cell wall biosynthesis
MRSSFSDVAARPDFANSQVTLQESGRGVLLLGPARSAVSGVSTHINQIFESPLAGAFRLSQFQVGREGRSESRAGMLVRIVTTPFAFAGCLISRRPRLVHINTSFEPKGYWRDLAYLAVAKTLRRKVIYQVHGGASPADFFAGSSTLTAVLRRVLSWVDAVVLLGSAEAEQFRRFAPEAQVVQIPNAVPVYAADLSSARYMAETKLKIVYLGRLEVEKGILDTIAAVRILRDRGIPVCLTIAGSGTALQQIREAIAAAALEQSVRLVGVVSGAAKEQLWQESHVLAFPSYQEGLPYAVLEAMSYGVVPVTTAVGSLPEAMQDHIHGLFVPARDPLALAAALARLTQDRAWLHQLALAGRERIVQKYSVARLAEDLKELYERLL